jgi:hypothetical protein
LPLFWVKPYSGSMKSVRCPHSFIKLIFRLLIITIRAKYAHHERPCTPGGMASFDKSMEKSHVRNNPNERD